MKRNLNWIFTIAVILLIPSIVYLSCSKDEDIQKLSAKSEIINTEIIGNSEVFFADYKLDNHQKVQSYWLRNSNETQINSILKHLNLNISEVFSIILYSKRNNKKIDTNIEDIMGVSIYSLNSDKTLKHELFELKNSNFNRTVKFNTNVDDVLSKNTALMYNFLKNENKITKNGKFIVFLNPHLKFLERNQSIDYLSIALIKNTTNIELLNKKYTGFENKSLSYSINGGENLDNDFDDQDDDGGGSGGGGGGTGDCEDLKCGRGAGNCGSGDCSASCNATQVSLSAQSYNLTRSLTLSFDKYYSLRDNYFANNLKGIDYIKKYYILSEYLGFQNWSFEQTAKIVQAVPTINAIVDRVLSNNSNSIVISNSDKIILTDLINYLKLQNTDIDYQNMLNEVKTDISMNTNKTKLQLDQSFQ